MRLRLYAAVLAATSLAAAPALAHPHDRIDPRGPDRDDQRGYDDGPQYGGYDHYARDAWLADCRQRISSRDSGVGGAVIGGVVGAVAGNRIAGRGNRTVGTLAGAAVGAAAGTVIDRAEDSGRNRDECEAYLDDYYARYTQGAGYAGYPQQAYYPAYGYGYPAQQPIMVPAAQTEPQCTETVEYVYEDVPVRPARRSIPRRAKAVPDKRVKLVPIN